jgi:hypothetical protein
VTTTSRTRRDRELEDVRARQAALLRELPDLGREVQQPRARSTISRSVEQDAIANRLQRMILAMRVEQEEIA